MKTAIFNVAEHEALYGPIETIDLEAEARKKLVRHFNKQKLALIHRKKLVKQRLLSLLILLLAVICCFLATEVPEMYFISLVFMLLGIPALITDTVIIY